MFACCMFGDSQTEDIHRCTVGEGGLEWDTIQGNCCTIRNVTIPDGLG